MAEQKDLRYSERGAKAPKQTISRLAFLLAGLLIAVTSISLLFVGFVASQASTEQAIRNEEKLFETTLQNRIKHNIHEQLSIARLDATVENIVLNFNYDFVRENIGRLWRDFRYDRSLVVSGEGLILAETFGDYTHITRRSLSETPEFMPVLDAARELYRKNRVRVPGGFSYRSLQGLSTDDFAVTHFVEIDGKPALLTALPIIPDKETVHLPAGNPTILLSAKFIERAFLTELNSQLAYDQMTFSRSTDLGPGMPGLLVKDIKGQPFGTFTWAGSGYGDAIWQTVVPVIFLLSIALGVLAFGIAWQIGKLTKSLQASESQNRYLALHDTLSGLANRLHFNRTLASSVANLRARPFAIVHCDLDKFKTVNDTHGHAAGDLVIKTVAERMKKAVGRDGLSYRVGGDEFIVLTWTLLDRKGLRDLADRMITSVSASIKLPDGADADIGLSVGISIAPKDGRDGETLAAAADAALYYAKQNGRGHMIFARDLPALKKVGAGEDVALMPRMLKSSSAA